MDEAYITATLYCITLHDKKSRSVWGIYIGNKKSIKKLTKSKISALNNSEEPFASFLGECDSPNLGTDASCTDYGVETIGFLCHSDRQLQKQPRQFCLVLPRVTHCVHVDLAGGREVGGGGETHTVLLASTPSYVLYTSQFEKHLRRPIFQLNKESFPTNLQNHSIYLS